MYDIIVQIIDHAYTSGDNAQTYIYYTCGALIIILTCVFIDLVYRVFRGVWRR